MNIREVECLLRTLRAYHSGLLNFKPGEESFHPAITVEIAKAINWCQSQQNAAARRKVEFKLRAAEQREALR